MIERYCQQHNRSIFETMSNYQLIKTSQQLNQLMVKLRQEACIAVDTESDSLYSYFEKVCLLQVSTETENFIIDPLLVDITPIGEIFASPNHEKIFHAAEFDILSLNRDYGFEFDNLFDTMIAAKILGWEKIGLGNILEKLFSVKSNKQFQQYNWGKRPIDIQALNYAYGDTAYLHQLRALQIERLTKNKRLKEARAAFRRLKLLKSTAKHFSPSQFWRIKNAKFLEPDAQALLQALFVFRDNYARHVDMPPFKIMSDATLVSLSENPPQNLADLKRSKGINRRLLKLHAQKILKVLQARHAPPQLPKRNGHTQSMHGADWSRYEHLRSWRNGLAKNRGVEPDVILPNGTLKAIARANPHNIEQLKQKKLLGVWQFETYAHAIIQNLDLLLS